MQSLGGRLLIAGANLWDPSFRRAIVLIGHHDEQGAVGVILNRPTEIAVEEAVPALAPLVEPGERLFVGGPVQQEAAVVLADFVEPERARVVALGSIGFLPEEVDADAVGGIRRARIFAGYAGWGAGQLERELGDEAWFVEPALPGDLFSEAPGQLWDDVLRRKGGRFELLRLMPVDPSQN